jgi:hypothetical protein
VFLEVYPQVLGVSTVKHCPKCGNVYPATAEYFYMFPDGRPHYTCKECQKSASQSYRDANPDRVKAYDERYRKEHRERRKQNQKRYANKYPERKKEAYKKWLEANPEKKRESDKAWRRNNRARRTAQTKIWRRNNPDKYHAIQYRRRARLLGNGGACTSDDLAAIRAAQTDKRGRLICWDCGKPIKGTPDLDHWISLSEGGTSDPGNLHYMHATCNRSKGAKHPHDMGRLI